MKLFLAITSCAALASALTTSADKKPKYLKQLKGKKEKKVTATFDDLNQGGSAYEPGVRYRLQQPYQFLVFNGFSVGKHDSVDDINIWRDHNDVPGPAWFGISKHYEPEVRSFDLKQLAAGCFNSTETAVGGGAVGCDIEFKGIAADDKDGEPSGEDDVTFLYTYRIEMSEDGSGVSTVPSDMHCVKFPDDFEGLKKVEMKIVDHSVWGVANVKPKMVFDDITYKVHGKHL